MPMNEKLNRYHVVPAVIAIFIAIVIYSVFVLKGEIQIKIPPIAKTPPPIEIKRPGTSGIVLSGPPEKDCKFGINPNAAGLKSIDWRVLTAQDPTADVVVHAVVGSDGMLTINHVNDRGHPQAGRFIQDRMATWVFTTCKHGDIYFWYNAGANRVVIDARGCIISNPAGSRVVEGKLHLIDAPSGVVQTGSFPR